MSSAPSLYRRHRPRTFDEVVGQEHIVRTLRNAIERGKVHHAYLFVGSRGTGKTSMAKILAAALNCEHGPTPSPCGACPSCTAIAAATSLDVIEMDAASNNSVDDIRELRERVAYAPVSGRHKIYILDEAHMLSPQAWNAFLKTLEEPPPRTVFVLATTEAQKVLPTVVDRCHRFDFGRPTVEQIAAVVRRAADAEDIEIPDEACALLARSATGSFRDALGTLEQLAAYAGRRISVEDALAVLGAADADLLFGTLDAVAASRPRDALLAAARVSAAGRDPAQFFRDLEGHARALMVCQTLGEVPAELRTTPENDARLADQAGRVPPATVVRVLDLLADGLAAMRNGADARTRLEVVLLKAAAPELDPSAQALLARIERLERGGGASAPAGTEPPAGQAAVAVAAEDAGGRRVRAAATAGVAGGSNGEAPRAAATLAGQAAAAAAAAAGAAEPPAPRDADVGPGVVDLAAGATEVSLELSGFAALWPAVLDTIAGSSPMLAAALADARPAALEGRDLVLAWSESATFLKRKAEHAANREAIAAAIRAVTGVSLRLRHELRAEAAPAGGAPPRSLSEDELIARFLAEFDAQELPPDDPPPTA